MTDEAVPIAVRRRVPFVLSQPTCPAGQGITQLAMRLESGIVTDREPGGFFNRMNSWLRR